jgi:hypothetical protein
MNGLMGDLACKPIEERGIYAVYQKGDVAALKERCRRLNAEREKLIHENALLNERLNRYERAACYGDDLEWTNERRGR